jgi:cytochrome c biogenesis protein CcmG/thiol:disulfide interchange protein DsbE
MSMMIGGLLFLFGLTVTIGSIAAGGERIIVAYGAMIFGAIQFVAGFVQSRREEAVGGAGTKHRLVLWVPFAAFVIFLAVVAVGLFAPAERVVRSGLIGRPVPAFALAPGMPGRPGLSSAALSDGQPHVVNVFASWCLPCRVEAPQLDALARRGIPIDGIAVRDRPQDLAQFLSAYGDPFRAIGADTDRRVQMELGSAGVPETFVIDGRGIIRHQHIGAITEGDMAAIVAAYEAAR